MGNALAAFLMLAAATAQPVSPREVVQAAVGRVIAVMEEAHDDQTAAARTARRGGDHGHAEIRRIVAELFDFDEMARRSLSRHWAARSSAERAEFVQLFTTLFERAYLGRIQSYAGGKIVYLGEEIDGPFAAVKSRVVTGRRPETALDYRLLLKDSQWKVYDVLVDGVSFVSTYRAEFNRVIQSSSYGALLQRMREKSFSAVTSLRRSPS